MCGIFASAGFEPDPRRIDIVAHRGPDGRGWNVFESASGPIALGHRRLAIIDVSEAGLQPMSDSSGRWWMVFNGEIYNYVELREELRSCGEIFTTESDSEVLLRAWMTWGEGALDRLRGMFAFIIWDVRESKIYAARDRFGIKPLYVFQSQHGVAFGSEIKQLLGLPGQSGHMNRARVYDYLAYGMSNHTSETMFDGVFQVRGGEIAVVDLSHAAPAMRVRRWYPAAAGKEVLSEAAAAERFRDLLSDAVRLHMRSDVPIGSCLSGGLDSSSIVCLMANLMGKRDGSPQINTVSACYADKSVDEKPFMDAVVAHAQTTPHFIYPRPEDIFSKASDITWHQDEPFGSSSIFAQWCVFEEARRVGIKVMLDGQGADEQLAGYHSGFPVHISSLIKRGQLLQVLKTFSERRRYHGAALPQQLISAVAQLLPQPVVAMLRGNADAGMQHSWLGSDFVSDAGKSKTAKKTAQDSLGLPDVSDLRSLCLNLTFASNLPMLLHWEDRSSMAHSIEARVPFLDHPLVEFSLALGNDHKIVGGDTKRVLRQAMSGILPDVVLDRRDKLGFATPEDAWFRGPLRKMVEEGIEETAKLYPELVNAAGIRTLAKEMLDGRRKFDFLLWRVVNLGIWGKRFSVGV